MSSKLSFFAGDNELIVFLFCFLFYCCFAVSEHYQGNRFRNQVVRQDFPHAVDEQLKEREEAERRAAIYYQMMREQEEADKKVAFELANNLKRDQEAERRRVFEQTEAIACQMKRDLVLNGRGASAEPILTEPIINELPIPPKNLGVKFNGQRRLFHESEPSTSGVSSQPPPLPPITAEPQLNYVSLDLNMPKNGPSQRLMVHTPTQYTQVLSQHSPSSASTDEHHYEHINLQSHTPEKKAPPPTITYLERDYSFPSTSTAKSGALPPKPSKHSPSSYELPKLPPKNATKDASPTNPSVQKLTTDTFDFLMGNRRRDEIDSFVEDGAASSCSVVDRQYLANNPNTNMLDRANDIENYGDALETASAIVGNKSRIRAMQELGVPPEEILEIDRRLTQQEKDEVKTQYLLFVNEKDWRKRLTKIN